MKNLKIYLPQILAIATAVTLVSCHNDRMIEEHKEEVRRRQIEVPKVEDILIPIEDGSSLYLEKDFTEVVEDDVKSR